MTTDHKKQVAALFTAAAEGKEIQRLVKDDWIMTDLYSLTVHATIYPELYRVKPAWTLPAPPEGKSWHRQDFAESDLPEGWRPLLLGEPEQKEDQCFVFQQWHDDPVCSTATPNDNKRRTRRPLPAEPKFIPWDFLTAPLTLRVKRKNSDDCAAIALLMPNGFKIYYDANASGRVCTFAGLLSDFTQIDGEPCGRLEIQP